MSDCLHCPMPDGTCWKCGESLEYPDGQGYAGKDRKIADLQRQLDEANEIITLKEQLINRPAIEREKELQAKLDEANNKLNRVLLDSGKHGSLAYWRSRALTSENQLDEVSCQS